MRTAAAGPRGLPRALQAAAGLQLTITIATRDGAGNEADLQAIEQAAASMDSTALATTISAVTVAAGLPPVTVTNVEPPEQGTASIEVKFSWYATAH